MHRRLKNSRSEYEDIESSDTDSEVENILNRRIPRRTLRIPSSSSDESDDQTEIAADGTMWNEIKAGSTPGRRAIHTIFKKANGPTAFAKRNIINGIVSSAFSLIIDRQIIDHIITCTELEAFRVLGKKLELSHEKFNNFLAVLYARGAY